MTKNTDINDKKMLSRIDRNRDNYVIFEREGLTLDQFGPRIVLRYWPDPWSEDEDEKEKQINKIKAIVQKDPVFITGIPTWFYAQSEKDFILSCVELISLSME